MSAIQRVTDLINVFAQQKQEFANKAKEALEPIFTEFLEKNPKVRGIVWIQYTPYFNDGDPCEFGVNEPSFYLYDSDQDTNDFDYDDDDLGRGYSARHKKWNYETKEFAPDYTLDTLGVSSANCFQLTKLINNPNMEEVFQAAYGDGSKITVTRDGVKVTEWQHD